MNGGRFFSRQGGQYKTIVDALEANVMVADHKLNIAYLNPSLVVFLQQVESELKKELPHFSLATLVGSNIDIFHKNPSHQRNLLASLQKEHKATIWVGRHAFDLRVMPLSPGSGQGGYVVEWANANARLQNLDYAAQIAAIGRYQAIIEFTPQGVILSANENFLKIYGYRLEEIVGQNHSMFLDRSMSESQEHAQFWEKLRAGQYQAAEFRRIAKGGKEIWIQGSYNPILDFRGNVAKIVKFATDATRRVHSVADVGHALNALAEGNLAHRISETLTPELDMLRVDFNAAVEKLQSTMQGVGHSAGNVHQGTEELRGTSDDLSKRTEQQAASLQQTAAALNEITRGVQKTSEGAAHARQVVGNAKHDAEESAVVVSRAVSAMSSIESSSSQIGQIIGVIDEIAFQTNLLALNAGVEAARAGEAGRGFAVVASEVRALAQRSAEAAKEIKTLILGSSQQVMEGAKLVEETGKALERIVSQVASINAVVSEIAANTEEQAKGLGEVNTAVSQMDQVTQQNAAMVEESTAAIHTLAQESEELGRLVQNFQLNADARSSRTAQQSRRSAAH
jgi:methyl-accepting chemotaxis protein